LSPPLIYFFPTTPSYSPSLLGIRGRIFHFDNLASTHESRVLILRIKNTHKTSPHAKAQERKDGFAEDPIIILLIEYSVVKRILREGNSSLKISLGALCALA